MDDRMFREGTFISNNRVLMEVMTMRVIGGQGAKRRVVTAENCRTLKTVPITEDEMKEFFFVKAPGEPLLTKDELTKYTLPAR